MPSRRFRLRSATRIDYDQHTASADLATPGRADEIAALYINRMDVGDLSLALARGDRLTPTHMARALEFTVDLDEVERLTDQIDGNARRPQPLREYEPDLIPHRIAIDPLETEMLSLTVDAATLLTALTQTAKFAAKNSAVPIRGCVLVTVDAEGVTLHASDAALGFTTNRVPGVVKGSGSICLPAVPFLAAVKATGDGPLTLQEIEAVRATVRAPGLSYTLIGMDAEDYPARYPVDTTECLTFRAVDLAAAFAIVGPNIAPDDNRYGLNGLHLELSEGRARVVATDGNRLAWVDVPCTGSITMPRQSLIARVGVAALSNLLGAGDVTFAPGGSYVEVRTDAGTMHAQFVTADFPDYRQVLPARFNTFVTANRAALLRAVDRVLPFAGGSIPEVEVTISAGTDLTMKTRKLDAGDSAVTVAVDATGDDLNVGVNGRYLRDALTTMDAENVTLAFSGVLGPIFVVTQGTPTNDTAGRLNCIMPVRMGR